MNHALRYSDLPTLDFRPSGQAVARPNVAKNRLALWLELAEPPAPDPWRTKVESRLTKLLKYQRGWDGYSGMAPSSTTTTFVQTVLNSVMRPDTPAPSIVPTHGGGIQLEWHTGGLDIELMVYRPFEAELSVDYDDGRPPLADHSLATDFSALSLALQELSQA